MSAHDGWTPGDLVSGLYYKWTHTSGAVVRHAGAFAGHWPYYFEDEAGQRRKFKSLSKAQEAALKKVVA